MDMTPELSHSTFSPLALLLMSVFSSASVVLNARRRATIAAVATAIVSVMFLVFVAGAHIPWIQSFAPRTFCFGDIGAVHFVAFVLPLLALIVSVMRAESASVG